MKNSIKSATSELFLFTKVSTVFIVNKNHYLYILHVKYDVFYERILLCTCEIFILWKLII